MKNKVAEVVVGLPIKGPFDYFIPEAHREKIAVGARVSVPFGPRKLVGYVVDLKPSSSFKKLKSLYSLLDDAPILDEALLNLTKDISKHYGCSWGEAMEAALPQALRKGKSIEGALSLKHSGVTGEEKSSFPQSLGGNLKQDPRQKISGVTEKEKYSGVTEKEKHSGVTQDCYRDITLLHSFEDETYWKYLIEEIKKTLAIGQGVIVLVPEVSLISKVGARLKQNIPGEILLLDKKFSPKQELEHWVGLKEGAFPIVVGARSTVFAPVKNLGLMILCDEGHAAYKQEQSPHYHARTVAMMRLIPAAGRLILSSLCPSIEMWHLAQKKKIQYIPLNIKPGSVTQVVDTSDSIFRKGSIVSFPLRAHMEKVLNQKGKILLVMNRKGFSTKTSCVKCGFVLKCQRCDVNLTYLYSKKKMVCRRCGFSLAPPTMCPQCQNSYLKYSGLGIEKLESELSRLFPQARVNHLDKDNTGDISAFDLLIATQAFTRMADEHTFNLVGTLRVDGDLNRPDYDSAHATFARLMRLSFLAKEKFILQTSLPDHYVIQNIVKGDFAKFYKEELKFRKQAKLPPFCHLAEIRLRGFKEAVVFEKASALYQKLCEVEDANIIEIGEPQADIVAKLRDKYRFTIIVKGKDAAKLMTFLQNAVRQTPKKRDVTVSVDIGI